MEEDMRGTAFIWSDNWYVEDGKAWFVEGWGNALCCLDLNTQICECIALIPRYEVKTFRRNPRVIKIGSEIYCMPDLGNYIWVYQIDCAKFLQIEIYNPKHERISICDYWKCGNRLYAVAMGLSQVIEINLEGKNICAYYTICNSDKESLERSIKVGSDIYTVSGTSNRVYQFNLETKESIEHILPEIEGKMNTICYDGRKFWLGGNRREVYVWDKKKNIIETLRNFPKGFGMYDFSGDMEEALDQESEIYNASAFIESRVIERCVWFISFHTNKIIYVDIDSYIIRALEMPDEKETKESLRSHSMASKYLLQYILEDRYLGLFSVKNNWVVEIDTKNFQAKVKKFSFDYGKYVNKLEEYVFEENKLIDRKAFKYLLTTNIRKRCEIEKINVGEKIYNQIKLNL